MWVGVDLFLQQQQQSRPLVDTLFGFDESRARSVIFFLNAYRRRDEAVEKLFHQSLLPFFT